MFSVPVGEIMCQDILELFLLVIKIELAASESHNNSLFPFCASFTNTKGREQTLPTVQLCSLLFLSVYAPGRLWGEWGRTKEEPGERMI